VSNRSSAHFHRIPTILLLALSLAGSSALGATPDHQTLRNALHKDLKDYLAARSSIEHISTLSMTITFRGESDDISDAVGTTEYGGDQRVTLENVFQIGSNTKSFTSALILRLEAEGVLSIDDTLGKWLPQYPAWSKVTIRQLLDMTSGIPTYDGTAEWGADYENNPYRKFTAEQLVAYVYPTIKTPGAAFEYSNTGYILAQMIIEKASWCHSYKAELDQLIANTDLHNTFYEPDFYPAAVKRQLVSGYYVNTDDKGLEKLLGSDTKDYSLGWTQAAGGIIATPRDLTKWVRALFEGEVLQPKQKQELKSLVAIPGAEPIEKTSSEHPAAFGLGVFQITDEALGLFWGYQGSTIGYRAVYSYFPESGAIICVFTNSQAAPDVSTVNTVLVTSLYNTLKAHGKI
jgi:D-alanyl-D-alanine carboxypeptidase